MLEAACDRAQAVVLDQVFFNLDLDKFRQVHRHARCAAQRQPGA
ncbi:hypothetical protein [Roseateles sp.]